MPIDRQHWTPPPPPQRGDAVDIAGALGGSRLWQQPRLAAERARLDAFVAPGPPLAIEIGFDHGITLLDHARAWPDWHWLGAEIRKRRVTAIAKLAPDNCLPMRVDARVLVGTLLPADRVQRVDILFPTPALDGRHLLLSPTFVANLERVLAPGARVHIETDVPGLYQLASRCFACWPQTEAPPATAALSRRARVCRRDDLPVWALTVRRP